MLYLVCMRLAMKSVNRSIVIFQNPLQLTSAFRATSSGRAAVYLNHPKPHISSLSLTSHLSFPSSVAFLHPSLVLCRSLVGSNLGQLLVRLRVLAHLAHVDALRQRAHRAAVLLLVVNHFRCLHILLVVVLVAGVTRARVAHVVVAAELVDVLVAGAEAALGAIVAAEATRGVGFADVAGQLLVDAAAALVASLSRNTKVHLAHRLRVVLHMRLSVHAILALGLLVGQWTGRLPDLRSVQAEVGPRVLHQVVVVHATVLNLVLVG